MMREEQSKVYGRGEIEMIDSDENPCDGPTETTPLLDAGVEQQQTNQSEDTPSNGTAKQHFTCYGDFEGLPWWKRPHVFWLLGPYSLSTLAYGGMMVPKIELIVSLVCRHYFTEQQSLYGISSSAGESNAQCNSAAVQKRVAAFMLVLSVLAGGLSAFTVPKLGALSDRYGRTRLIVIASCGGIVNEIITIITAKYPDVFDYRFLMFGSIADGITGSFTAVSVLGNSYVSDCSPPSKRGVSIGYLQACLFTGIALGPVLAGKFLLWTRSILSIFYAALGSHVLVILVFWFIVPESLSKKRRIMAQEKHQLERETVQAGFSGSLEKVFGPRVAAWITNDKIRAFLRILLNANPLAPLKMFVPSGRGNRRLRHNMLLLGFIDTVVAGATIGAGTVIILYAKYMFNWGTWESSRFISLISFFRVFVLLVIFPAINYFFRTRPLRRQRELDGLIHVDEAHSGADNLDIWTLRFALLSDLTGVLGYVFVRTEGLFMASAACTSFGGLASATVQCIFTKQIPAERIGSMLGAMGLLHAMGRVFAPVMFDGIYAGTIEIFPQAFVVVLASLFGLSILASLFVKPHLVLQDDDHNTVPARDAREREID
ncbi:MFS general substrate transporter [Xylaria nigripes]|nr:MFS general substrate transporter [Xylaria nigripes]